MICSSVSSLIANKERNETCTHILSCGVAAKPGPCGAHEARRYVPHACTMATKCCTCKGRNPRPVTILCNPMSSRSFSPSHSMKDGLGPLRTARSRPGRHIQSSPARVAGINLLDEGNTTVGTIGFARQHRRTASAPGNSQSPFATPKRHGTLPSLADRAETTDSYSGAPSPPIAGSTRPPPVSFRQSIQSLLRTPRRSSTDTPRTSYRARYTYTDDEADNSDGSRFDILSSDPFRSDSPVLQDIEDLPGPPVPPKSPVKHLINKFNSLSQPSNPAPSQVALESPVLKPLEFGQHYRVGPPRTLHIIPPSQLGVLQESQSPSLETTSTPASPVAAMRSAFNRMTNSATTGRSRIRLLSFIKEVKSPVTAYEDEVDEQGVAQPPKLNLHDFRADGPLFDPSSFQLPEIPLPKAKIRVEGPSLGHPAPPPAPPSRPEAPPTVLATHPGPSALQLHLHGDGEFEGYVIASPVESLRSPTPPPAPSPPPPVPTASSPTVPPAWIQKFREELEELGQPIIPKVNIAPCSHHKFSWAGIKSYLVGLKTGTRAP